jgi:hypothetical protein
MPTLEDVDTDVIVWLDEHPNDEPQCEGRYHGSHNATCVHDDGPATHRVVIPCCRRQTLQCATRVADLKALPTMTCTTCSASFAPADVWFIEL